MLGAILVSEMPPSATYAGGPWVTEIFVDPDAAGRGIGGALLARAAAALVGRRAPDAGPGRHRRQPGPAALRSRSASSRLQDVTVVDVPDQAGGVVSSST